MLIGLELGMMGIDADAVLLGLAVALVVALGFVLECEEGEAMRGKGSHDGRDIEVKKAAVVVNADRRGAEGIEVVEYLLALVSLLLVQSLARSVRQGEGVRGKREDVVDLVCESC
jgi:hypothetical protein